MDDNPVNVDLLEAILSEDYLVATATSGEECLEVLQSFLLDIVLLDILMPGIDGYETCRRIRAIPGRRYIKIIMVSARAVTSERLQGYEAGADDYITKPFDDAELLAKIRVYLRMKSFKTEKANMQTHNHFPQPRRSTFRILRKIIDTTFPIGGAILIVGTLVFEWQAHNILILFGVLLFEVGVWQLATRWFPNERKYFTLRGEVDRFLQLVRQLNTAALDLQEHDTAHNHQVYEEILDAMHQKVVKIGEVAGKTEEDEYLVHMN